MNRTVLYRGLVFVFLALGAIVYLLPSAVGNLPRWWQRSLPSQPLHLGLDLRGGSYLLLGVDLDKAVANALDRHLEDIRRELREAQVGASTLERRPDGRLYIRLANREKREQVREVLRERFPTLAFQPVPEGDDSDFVLALDRREELRLRQFALDQSLETIRNRIDQFGVTEPSIQRQGNDAIVVQLPGIQDPERAKDLIGKTAQLEFKLLAEGASPDRPPPNTEVLWGHQVDPLTGNVRRVRYVLEKRTLLTGDAVVNATVRPGGAIEGPYVELRLDARGARLFEQATAENVGRRLAIILDKTVYSAPVIKERIPNGRASITGHFDIKEARDLAIVLRAGALPAPVKILEERTVGPSLGKDSIRRGVFSFAVGGAAVVVFMLLYYRGAGVIADAALLINILYLLGALAAVGATLTLPGIAGIVLTTGMAVDANVLINERIREELRLGKSPRAAIEAGYERAWHAILDSNVTTFAAGLILFQFGSGPVRGFAVTLCVGIASTLLTAVYGTRVIYDLRLASRRLQRVSI